MSPALAGRFFITEPSGKPLLGEKSHLFSSCNGTGLDIHQRLNVCLFKDEKNAIFPRMYKDLILANIISRLDWGIYTLAENSH